MTKDNVINDVGWLGIICGGYIFLEDNPTKWGKKMEQAILQEKQLLIWLDFSEQLPLS